MMPMTNRAPGDNWSEGYVPLTDDEAEAPRWPLWLRITVTLSIAAVLVAVGFLVVALASSAAAGHP